NSYEPRNGFRHQTPVCGPAFRDARSALYWRSWRNSPRDVHHDQPRHGASLREALLWRRTRRALVTGWPSSRTQGYVGALPMEAAGAVDAKNAPTAPWK